MEKEKVSFDFDSTLSRDKIQEYAKSLIGRGLEVWICTSRFSPKNAPNKEWNDDLFGVADRLGILRSNIIFTNMIDKSEFLSKEFIFHLDDDSYEINCINREGKTTGISCFGNSTWEMKCDRLIKKTNKIMSEKLKEDTTPPKFEKQFDNLSQGEMGDENVEVLNEIIFLTNRMDEIWSYHPDNPEAINIKLTYDVIVSMIKELEESINFKMN